MLSVQAARLVCKDTVSICNMCDCVSVVGGKGFELEREDFERRCRQEKTAPVHAFTRLHIHVYEQAL